jgi:hemolysin activation/secretion protein
MMISRLILAATLCAAVPSFAQIPVLPSGASSGATLQRQIEEDRRRREEDRDQIKPVIEPLRRDIQEAPVAKPGVASVRFMVREIRFTTSEILSAEELSVIASAFQGRELTLADLQQLAVQVNELYRKKGVVTSQAVIPPQDVSSGVITVRLVEGRLGKIQIEGNDSTNERYVVDRLRLKPEDLMDMSTLEDALVRFNRTNDAQLQATLKPGERFSTTDLNIVMTEPPRQELRLTLDNSGSKSTGTERVGLAYFNRSVFGFRDDASLSTTKADGQESYSATYGFPVNSWGGRFNLGYYDTSTEIKKGALASLNITGKSIAQIASFRQPAFVDSSSQVDLVVGGKKGRNTNWIDKVLLLRTDTLESNLGVDAQLFDRQSNWSASYIRSFGQAETQISENKGFVIDRGSLRHNRDLGHGFSFRGTLSWQESSRRLLPSSEQLSIGGEGSVRGYPVGVYTGDIGQVINLELHHSLLAASDATNGVGATGFFFLDYGRVKPYRPPNSRLDDYDELTGVGWGMLASMGKHAYAKLTLGYGLDRVPQQSRNYEINLQVIVSAF